MENYYPKLYFGFIHILVAIVLFCSLLLWSQREDGQRSRRFLACIWLFLLFLYAGHLLRLYHYGDITFEGVLSIRSIIFGLLILPVIAIYPIEVVAPRWLNIKRFLLLFLPVILAFAVCGTMYLFGNGFRVLNTLNHIVHYWHEPNVWIRLFIVLFVCGYAFILYTIPYSKKQGNVTFEWICTYMFGNTGIVLFYLGLILFGIYPAGLFYTLYFVFYVGCVTYHELYVRLFIPDNENAQYAKANSKVKILEPVSETLLRERLENCMQQQALWQDPNLSLRILAAAVGTTCANLELLIRHEGYSAFDDYIARYRIRKFCQLVIKGHVVTLRDAFYLVGFRYYPTALNHFKRIMNLTPEEYAKKCNVNISDD